MTLGLRPNSPMTTTRVRSSIPRASRSSSRLRQGRVELGQQGFLQGLEVIAVSVPGRVGVGSPGDAGDPHAGLDQPACQQDALAVDVATVTVAGARVLAVDPDGVAHGRRGQEVEGPGLEAVEVAKALVAAAGRAAGPRARRPAAAARVSRAGLTSGGGESSGMPKSAAFGSLRMKSGSCDRPSQPPKKPPCGGPPAPSAVM